MTELAIEPRTSAVLGRWHGVCDYGQLLRERGVAALIGELQIAVFRTFDDHLYAIGNQDPFTGAYVLSRGIVGSRGEIPTLASPLLKQVFDLRTGACLDDPTVAVVIHPTRTIAGLVEVWTCD